MKRGQLAAYTLLLVLLLSGKMVWPQVPNDSTNQSQAVEQDPWAYIDPISPKAKVFSKAPFPTHVVVPAAAIVVGGAVAIGLSANKKEPDPEPTDPNPSVFVLSDDNYSTTCGTELTIQPLQNDEGSGLSIVGLQNAPPGVVLLNDSTVLIPSNLTGDITFDILIEDGSGQSGSSTVTITLEDFSIEANNDQYNVDMGESVSGNVLDNDLCTTCTVEDISGGDGLLDWNADGSFTYTASFDFAGETNYTVSVENACGNQATSTLTFIISPPAPCGFDWPGTITTEPSDCGLSNGKANPQDHVGGYNFSWSNGVNAPDNEDIPSGTYELLITDTASGCVDTLTIEITELPVDYGLSVEAIPGTCGETDNAILNSNAAPDNVLTVSLSGSTTGELTNVSSPTLMLGDAIALNPGLLTITVYSVEAGAGCSQQITHTVEQSVLPDMSLTDDVYEVNTGETTSGNVLDNDVCQDCQLTSVEDPEGTLDWQANGDFSYTASADGGEVSFVITVTDGCGQEATETLTFIISPPAPCSFDWPGSVTTEPADCGLSNGAATAAGPTDGYDFAWDNGNVGAENASLAPGLGELVVTDQNSNCTDTLTAEITELPADYALEIILIPGFCGEVDGVQVNSNASPSNLLVIDVSGATNGTISGVDSPQLMLADYLTLNPGELILTVFSEDAGPGCTETAVETLVQSDPAPEVLIMEVVQPQPPEMIGAIYLEVLSPSFPVDIIVNGEFVVTTVTPDVALEGLEPGVYEILVVNTENGCISAPVLVELIPGGIMALNDSPHWSPEFLGNSSWMGSPQEFHYYTPEGGEEGYVLEPNVAGPIVGGTLSRGRWFASGAYSALRYRKFQNEQPSTKMVSYTEFSVGSSFKIKRLSASLKIGQSNWNSGDERVIKARGWFVEGGLRWPLKNLPGSLKTGVRAGMLEGYSKVFISPQVQWAFSK